MSLKPRALIIVEKAKKNYLISLWLSHEVSVIVHNFAGCTALR
jgi:hypothetical protein